MNFRGDKEKDIICALSTPHGIGGISVIRVCGESTFSLIKKICPFLPDKPETHKVYFGTIEEHSTKNKIDEVLITCFHKDKSFTGDETVEISCHGNPTIVSWIIREIIQLGARAAERGEFTFRAFMNGNIDLVQAESVLSLIESKTQKATQQSLQQLKGYLSKDLETIEKKLLWCLSRLEVGIDFSTEDIEVVSFDELTKECTEANFLINKLISSYRSGKIINDGLHVLFIGQPNVGKSSLFNLFLGEEKAIVTDIAGTTRDLIQSSIIHKGYKISLTDTAGLHETQNVVEKIGIERSKKLFNEADVLFFIFDVNKGLSTEDFKILDLLDPSKTIIIGNKLDLLKSSHEAFLKLIEEQIRNSNFYKKTLNNSLDFMKNVILVSSQDEKYLESLYISIDRFIDVHAYEDQTLLFQSRHYENLSLIDGNLNRALLLIRSKASAEFISLELKEALILMHETLGKRFDDQIMDRVFKEFCIGK